MSALTRQEVTPKSSAQEQSQFLTFMLREDVYAIGILNIKEIIQYGRLTEVPRMPAFIRGVINLRGEVVPVIDLGACFGREPKDVSRRTCIIIVEVGTGNEKRDMGVIVDAVNEVLEITGADMEQAPAFGTKIRADFIQGMGRIGERFIIILDINAVLSLDEVSLLGSALEPAGSGAESSQPIPLPA
jgi:purine-binding chemotaxis protein CheW